MPPSNAASVRAVSPSAGAELTAVNKKYTWQEVAKHNTAESCWVIINREVFDLTPFLDEHPGGKEMLLLAAGRDCTDLFAMYHVFNEKRATEKYKTMKIGDLDGPTEFPVYAPDRSGFYKTLKERVVKHFQDRKISPRQTRSPWTGLAAVLPLYVALIACFCVVHGAVWPTAPFAVKFVLAAAFGWLQVVPLMHWLHDASHGALGPNETWWKVLGRFAMDFVAGANIMPWHHQHILGHHVLTNVFGADPDLPMAKDGDMRRLVPAQVWRSVYKYQHIYLPILYSLLGIKIRYQDFSEFMINRMNGPVRVNWYDNVWIRIVGSKLVWASWRMLLPVYYLGCSWSTVLGYMLVADVISGFWLAYNFQVSHITEDMSWPNGRPGENSMELADSWAENQVKTGLGYAHDDKVWTYVCGALNFQIEHHLFPGLSQYYLPEVAPIVKATCKDFGIPYRYVPTFWEAFKAHIRFLKAMGEAGNACHID